MKSEKEVLQKKGDGEPDHDQGPKCIKVTKHHQDANNVIVEEVSPTDDLEGISESDKETTNKNTENSESNASKRVNKRKQRFPTKQVVELVKNMTGAIKTESDTTQVPTKKIVWEKKGKNLLTGLSGKPDKPAEEVVVRRSSRTPKKKKMFDELDDPEPAVKPDVNKVKKAKVVKATSVTKKTPAIVDKKERQVNSEQPSHVDEPEPSEETSENEIIDTLQESCESIEENITERKKEDVGNIVQQEFALDGTEKDDNKSETEEMNRVEDDTSGEEKNDKENKDIAKMKARKLRKSNQCSVCKKMLSSEKALERHMTAVHIDNKGEFNCKDCEACFKSKKAFDRHLQLHSENKFKCYECEQAFISQSTLKDHVKKTHAGMLPFKCVHANCEKSFSSMSNRKKHIEAVHLNIRSHCCHLCEKMYKNSSALRVHLYCCHSAYYAERPKYECDVCHKSFTQKLKLKMHATVHTSLRPYKCKYEDCKKTFRLKSNRMKHERVHEKFQPYVCETCGQTFSRRVYLETHQYKHTGVKKFQCAMCQKTFSQKGNLDVHMKIHTENREFVSCMKCGKTFSNKSNLTKHLLAICQRTQKGHFFDHRTDRKIELKTHNGETVVVHPVEEGSANSNISLIFQGIEEIESNDTVVIIQDDQDHSSASKLDKACGTDEIRTVEYVHPRTVKQKPKPNVVQKSLKPRKVNHSEIVVVNPPQKQPQQQQSLTEIVVQPKTEPHSVDTHVSQVLEVPDTSTIYFEEPESVDGVQVVSQEQVVEHEDDQNTVYMTYTESSNVSTPSVSLTDIVLPSSSDNVEYEIVSSGLDGVEEGILKEFLSKWNQQGTMAGTTVILDVQNRENAGNAGIETGPDSVQYIVTVKDQE